MQGVSINLFVKPIKKKRISVYHYDLFGKRNDKYNFYKKNSLKTIDFKIEPILNLKPFFLVNKDK